MENIILTGATGFLGKHILEELVKFYHVRCLVRKRPDSVAFPNASFRVMDFQNPVFGDGLFDNVYAVVHAMAVKSSLDPDIMRINVDFTKRLVDAARIHNVRKIVYISSETVQLPGEDRYVLSKRLAEDAVKKCPDHLILRPTVIYGEGDRSNIGLLIRLTKALPVVPVIGNGRQLMQPVYVKDVSKSVLLGLKNNISGTYLIAGRSPLRYREIVDVISKALGRRRLIMQIPVFAAYVLAAILKIAGLPFIQKSQIDNLKKDKKYAVEETEKLFGIRFTDPKDGLYKVAGGMNG